MNIPSNLKYTKTDEWFDPATGKAGLTDYAQGQLSDIVFVELSSLGKTLKQNDPFGTVEAVKAVSDVYAPVSGEVFAVNDELKTAPDIANKDPYGKGWMVKIRMSNPTESSALLAPADYEKLAAKSAH